MEYTITGISQDKLEEKLALYSKLTAQRDDLVARLEKVDKEKASVSEDIYQKVKSEYNRQLEVLTTQIDPMESEFNEFKRESEKELAELDEQIRALEEELSEAEFRHRVGEYNEGKIGEIRSRLEPDLVNKSARKTDIAKRLSSMGSVGIGEPKSAPEETNDTAAKPGEPPEVEPASEKPRAVDDGNSSRARVSLDDPLAALTDKPAEQTPSDRSNEAPTSATDSEPDREESSFENPQAWLDEFGDEKKDPPKSTQKTASKEDSESNDSLSVLADPSDEQRKAPESSDNKAAETEEVCVGFPNLVIVTGSSSGKKVPLLPMTMSVGREHDNNIELKDPEVARYHARILYERGRFVLEDLESSNGTWLNGEEIKQAPLKNGDRVKIGETEMVIDFD